MIADFLKQALIVANVSLRGIQSRGWASANAVVGTAAVVGVLVVLLSIGEGYKAALRMTGSADNVIVMRASASSELESSLSGEQALIIKTARGVARLPDGAPLASAEAYVIANIRDRRTNEPKNVAFRGVDAVAFALRRNVRLVAGREFSPGRKEIVVGRRAQEYFKGLQLGAELPIANGMWKVVGVFEANGSVAESEMWTDRGMLQSAYQRGDTVQVVYVRLPGDKSVDELMETLNRDPRLNVKAEREDAYYEEQSEALGRFVKTLGYGIALLMGLGALFSSLNTSYSAVAARTREIATLNAIGFDDLAIVASVLGESLAIALFGACVGSAIAYAIFDGHVTSTLFYSRNFSQVVFAFAITSGILAQAAACATVIGLIGGLGPASRSIRLPVSLVLSERR